MKKKTVLIAVAIFSILTVFIVIYTTLYRTDGGKIEIKKINNNDQVVIISPVKNSEISSPLSISGRARGSWFFEGSFPIVLLDSYRNVIAEGHVTAQSEWMTQDFVKFLGSLQFNNYIKGSNGFLILKKDNPSGLKEKDESIEIPIIFK